MCSGCARVVFGLCPACVWLVSGVVVGRGVVGHCRLVAVRHELRAAAEGGAIATLPLRLLRPWVRFIF